MHCSRAHPDGHRRQGRVRWPMHTGRLEVIKRMAYGYRDTEYFFLKIRAVFPGNP